MRVLAIFAHPDDESYGPAGTLACAIRAGHTVALLTLTHGESASMGISKNLSPKELARRRCHELKTAVRLIGIQHLNQLNLGDKKLQYIPEPEGIAIVRAEIDRFDPDLIISYHENTISGHPDHLAVTNWVLDAVRSMKFPPRLLLYGLDHTQTSMVDFERWFAVPGSEITHRIDVEDCLDVKTAAICCHKTQLTLWTKLIKHRINLRNLFRWEYFVQKWPAPEGNTISYDLFEEAEIRQNSYQ
jgi:LmbE family N-acetylglucosaminyl deacetylase